MAVGPTPHNLEGIRERGGPAQGLTAQQLAEGRDPRGGPGGEICQSAVMYVVAVPNRHSPPAILLRESYREGGRVKNRTLANLSQTVTKNLINT
jgi:hypothetical protein